MKCDNNQSDNKLTKDGGTANKRHGDNKVTSNNIFWTSHNNPDINLKDVSHFASAKHVPPSQSALRHTFTFLSASVRPSEDTLLFEVINVQLCLEIILSLSVCGGNRVKLWQKSSLIINASQRRQRHEQSVSLS